MTRPRVTPSDALLLFVTEPQQLDALHEYGTETLTPDSIRVDEPNLDNVTDPDVIGAYGLEYDGDGYRDCCPVPAGDDCTDECDCSSCENDRALDDDADAYADRCRD